MPNRPAPLEVRKAKGNPGKRAMPKDAPSRVDGVPEPPDWLKGKGLEYWHSVVGLLFARGQLSVDSMSSLLGLCQSYAEWEELRADIEKNGRFQVSDSGLEKNRPALTAFQDADRRYKGWLVEFGLTDASRGKVSAAPGDESGDGDPLSRYGLN